MKFVFSINYRTTWGQILCLNGSLPELQSVKMVYTTGGCWTLSIDLPDNTEEFEYCYFLKNTDGSVVREWGKPRKFLRLGSESAYYLYDVWMDKPYNSPFFLSTFTKLFYAPTKVFREKDKKYVNPLTLKVLAPEVQPGQCLAVAGNTPSLGKWNVPKAVLMDNTCFPEWKVTLSLTRSNVPIEYKFVVVDPMSMEVIVWENGENRCLNILPKKGASVIVHNGVFRGDPSNWRCAGTSIPVFSLRSESSFGIGDFVDLKKMIDWAEDTDQKVVQILPVNDTTITHTWKDSNPYKAISIYALHPLYLGLSAFGRLKDIELKKRIQRLQKELNALPEVDYDEVSNAKWKIYRDVYKEIGARTLQSAEFQEFFRLNGEWLIPYAAFCHFRDQYQTVDFHQWDKYAVFNFSSVQALCNRKSEAYDEMGIHCFLQFHLHKQLKDALDYAHSKGVILKGDVPVGISQNSVEAWSKSYVEMNPDSVLSLLRKSQMFSLEIQRKPKDPTLDFADTKNYPYQSICTTSTHDMNALRAWWEEDGTKRQIYYNKVLGQKGEAPVYAEPWLCSMIIRHHLQSNSMFAVFPLQDWLSMDSQEWRPDPRDERINEPEDPHYYWRYRMHLTLEELLGAEDLNDKIRNMISEAGRE